MKDWQKRLAHAKALRDAAVACGNPKPTTPDPEGGLVQVKVLKYNGKIFWNFMKEHNHSDTEYELCSCSQ